MILKNIVGVLVLSGSALEAGHFSCTFSDGPYVRVPLKLWVEVMSQLALKVRVLPERTSVHQDRRKFRFHSVLRESHQFSFRAIRHFLSHCDIKARSE